MDLLDIINVVYLLALKELTKNIIKDKILKALKFMGNNKALKPNRIINMILKLLLLDLLLIYL